MQVMFCAQGQDPLKANCNVTACIDFLDQSFSSSELWPSSGPQSAI